MKRLTVYHEHISPIELYDEDKSKRSDYIEEVSAVFQLNEVAILETSQSSILIRPSRLTAIKIDDVADHVPAPEESPTEEPLPEKEPEKPEEDVITDVD